MEIIVCIKQVPGTMKVEVDEKTGVLKRDGIECKMNPYDLYAIETALRIKKTTGGNIKAVTMGPSQAGDIIKEAYMMGVDEGYIISDRRFAGSDVLATSYTLSQGIKLTGKYDLIICGKQTTDGDTAQVGPAIAEFLKIPHVTWVRKIESVDSESIVVEQDMADSFEVVELKYPCLITVEKGIFEPGLPSYKKLMETADREINDYFT
jgi:electron transfer flavoprotein beta subunit